MTTTKIPQEEPAERLAYRKVKRGRRRQDGTVQRGQQEIGQYIAKRLKRLTKKGGKNGE